MEHNHPLSMKNPYPKFALIMAVSFVIMYVIMFLNVAELDHIYNSLTRFYMTTLMIAAMAISMLLFMWKMYPNRKINLGIMTSSNADFKDPEVKKLADDIIIAQENEIKQMKKMIHRLENQN